MKQLLHVQSHTLQTIFIETEFLQRLTASELTGFWSRSETAEVLVYGKVHDLLPQKELV